MIDQAERDRIAEQERDKARLEHRVKNLEADMEDVKAIKVWGFRAIGAGVIYMLVELGKLVASSGGLPK